MSILVRAETSHLNAATTVIADGDEAVSAARVERAPRPASRTCAAPPATREPHAWPPHRRTAALGEPAIDTTERGA